MAQQVEQNHVVLATENGVAWIRLNRPDKLNPIGAQTRRELAEALKQAERDPAVRAVVLIGSGRGFSAGADIREMGTDEGGMRSPEDVGAVLRDEYLPMLSRIRNMPKPVICGVNGVAAGIGASFAMACDIRIASQDATFVEAFVGIGLAPDGGVSWLLPRLVGRAKALEMFFTGKPLTAEEALRLGAVNKVVPKDEVEAECRALAERLAAGPVAALAGSKRAVNHAEGSTFEEAAEFESYVQEVCAASADFREGVTAFREKRAARFGAEPGGDG